MKYNSVFIFAAIGGILGFIFHLIWHFSLDIELFGFATHITWGVIHTVIGIIIGIGVFTAYFRYKWVKK